MIRSPLFILFEGIDGSGKSTQSILLHQYLNKIGVPAVLLSEPTNGPWGKKIREMLSGSVAPPAEEQHRLFILDREDDICRNVSPALGKGITVVMDRYFYSNAAYQGASGLSSETILNANREKGFPEPDRVYLIDIEPETALKRISLRSGCSDIFERRSFLDRVRSIYRSLAGERFCVLDGAMSAGDVFSAVLDDLENRFILGAG